MEKTKCVICHDWCEKKKTPVGRVYWTEGNNAEPVADGRCCDVCNVTVVIPARLRSWLRSWPVKD